MASALNRPTGRTLNEALLRAEERKSSTGKGIVVSTSKLTPPEKGSIPVFTPEYVPLVDNNIWIYNNDTTYHERAIFGNATLRSGFYILIIGR